MFKQGVDDRVELRPLAASISAWLGFFGIFTTSYGSEIGDGDNVCIEATVLFAPSCVNGGFTVSVRTITCTRIDPGEASMTTLKLTGLRKKSVVPLPT